MSPALDDSILWWDVAGDIGNIHLEIRDLKDLSVGRNIASVIKDVPLRGELSNAAVTLNDRDTLLEYDVCLPLFVDVWIKDEFHRVAIISPIHPAHRPFEHCAGTRGQVTDDCRAFCAPEGAMCPESRKLAILTR